VSASGSLIRGSGVTIQKFLPGQYLISFAAGTWSAMPSVVVSPFGRPGFFPVAEVDSVVVHADGSAVAVVMTSSTAGTNTPADAAFFFVATAT
jgi:hypothetical protein